MLSVCLFFIQLAPCVLGLALYQRLQNKFQQHQEILDLRLMLCTEKVQEKQTVLDEIVLKYDKRTTILRDKVAQLEKDIEYLDGVERRVAIIFRMCGITVGTFLMIFILSDLRRRS